jgi:hypothetical protein
MPRLTTGSCGHGTDKRPVPRHARRSTNRSRCLSTSDHPSVAPNRSLRLSTAPRRSANQGRQILLDAAPQESASPCTGSRRTRPVPSGADDSSDDNADDSPAPTAPSRAGSRRRSGCRKRGCALLGVKGSQGVTVIIVSEPSAKVARRVRTGRSTPARSRSSAAHNDIPRYADAQRISVHTEVLAR